MFSFFSVERGYGEHPVADKAQLSCRADRKARKRGWNNPLRVSLNQVFCSIRHGEPSDVRNLLVSEYDWYYDA